MKRIKSVLCSFLCLLFVLSTLPAASADAFIDEITDYEITVDVNEDATLNLFLSHRVARSG